jgi:hypothetical protein
MLDFGVDSFDLRIGANNNRSGGLIKLLQTPSISVIPLSNIDVQKEFVLDAESTQSHQSSKPSLHKSFSTLNEPIPPLPKPDAASNSKLVGQSNKRSCKKKDQFMDIVDKAKELACIFHGQVKSEKNFSMCKGQPSIRFSCQNEHNFFLSADQIARSDVSLIKS